MRFDRSPRLSNQVLDVLLFEVIQEGVPGSLLPRESDLAERFGISRGVTREVLRSIEERGVITVRHGHGAIVNPPDEWDILDGHVLNALLHGRGQISGLREVLECRQIIEVQIASLAAVRAQSEDTESIADALEAMRTAAALGNDNDGYAEADLAFHESLARATRNRPFTAWPSPSAGLLSSRIGHYRASIYGRTGQCRSTPECLRQSRTATPKARRARCGIFSRPSRAFFLPGSRAMRLPRCKADRTARP